MGRLEEYEAKLNAPRVMHGAVEGGAAMTAYTPLWPLVEPLVVAAQPQQRLPKPSASGWIDGLRSPLRPDNRPGSFGVRPDSATDPGAWKDFAGEPGEQGGSMADLAVRLGVNPRVSGNGQALATSNGAGRRIVATYDYRGGDGGLLYQVVRFEPKDFRQRRPDGSGGWVWRLEGVERVPYRLPELLEAARQGGTVYVAEGEKEAERFRSLRLMATCNPEGAGKHWPDEWAEYVRGFERVVVPADNDEQGRAHADRVARCASRAVPDVRVIERLPGVSEHGDVSDWLDAGGTREELERLVEETPRFSVSRIDAIQSNRDNRDNRAFNLTSLADLLAEPPEAVSYAWDLTLPLGGMSILGARPKTGKTTWARSVALAVARGEPVMGRKTTQGPVVYLALEEKRGELQRQLAAMGAATEPILIHTGIAPEDATEALRVVIAEHGPVLVVVDPLQDFARVRDMNDYSIVHAKLAPIRDLARETGVHIMLLHHNNKADDLLGSTQLFGIVDTLLLMSRREDSRTIRSIQRYGEDLPETVLTLDKETGIVSPAGDYRELQVEQAAGAVLEAVGREALTEADIRERVGGNQSLTAKAIRHLLDGGKLARIGAGKRGDPYIYSVCRLDVIGCNRETESVSIGNALARYGGGAS